MVLFFFGIVMEDVFFFFINVFLFEYVFYRLFGGKSRRGNGILEFFIRVYMFG